MKVSMSTRRRGGVLRGVSFGIRGNMVATPSFEGSVRRRTSVSRRVTEFCNCSGVPSETLSNITSKECASERGLRGLIASIVLSRKLSRIYACAFVDPGRCSGLHLPTSSPEESDMGVVGPLNRSADVVEAATIPSVLSILSEGCGAHGPGTTVFRVTMSFGPHNARRLPGRPGGVIVNLCNRRCSCFALGNIVRRLLDGAKVASCSVRHMASSPVLRPNETTHVAINNGALTLLKRIRPRATGGFSVNAHYCVTRISVSILFRGENTRGICAPLPGFPTMAHSLTFMYSGSMPIIDLRGRVRSTINGALRGVALFSICRNGRVRDNGGDITFDLGLHSGSGALASSSTSSTVGGTVGTVRGLNTALED